MKTIISSAEESVRAAAGHILARIAEKHSSVIALGALCGELRVWETVAALAREGGLPLEKLRFLAVCEFEGLSPQDENSVRRRLAASLFTGGETGEERLFVPDAADPAAFDETVRALGGIDLVLLGLGENARVGFNEPATQYDTHTHVQKLTDRTKRELAPLFGGEDKVPSRGVTLGFQELCAARDIVVIALGESRSKALYHMRYGRDDSVYPAAFLQLPPNVTVYADEAAVQAEDRGFDLVKLYGN